MRVIPVAYTKFLSDAAELSGYEPHKPPHYTRDADELAEFAGRNCYQSWNRPNPRTATNTGYLANILEQGHYSVLEHASVSFYVDGVSRALLTELERHRFLSFSVVSQRYVKPRREDYVVPPAIRDDPDLTDDYGLMVSELLSLAVDDAFSAYESIAGALFDVGLPNKQAREAARSVLPNATETKMVVTGNLRCWRDVIVKRNHEAADAEIREFSREVLKNLRQIAPSSVQDYTESL